MHGYVTKSSIDAWALSPNSFRIPLYQGFNLQDLYHILMIIQWWTEQFGRFQRQDPPSVQIHHTGKSHWVTSLQDKKDGTVYVLDSYSKTFTLTPSLEIQLSAIYGQGKTNLLIKPEVQQQTNGYDCGVYALANLVEFCYNGTYNTHITLRGIWDHI